MGDGIEAMTVAGCRESSVLAFPVVLSMPYTLAPAPVRIIVTNAILIKSLMRDSISHTSRGIGRW